MGCAMGAQGCVICGFIYTFHRKVRKGRKDLRDAPVSFLATQGEGCGGAAV